MTENRRLGINIKTLLLTGIVGWIVSLYALWHWAKVKAGVDLGEAFCNINAKVNCDTVALSDYSHIGGISVATFGLIFFAIVIVLALRALRFANEGKMGALTRQGILALGAVGALTSVTLGLVSWKLIGAFCIVCIIVYLLCFSLLALAWKIYKESAPLVTGANTAAAKNEKFSATFIVGALAFVAVQFLFQPLANYAAHGGKVVQEGEALPPEFMKQVFNEYDSQNSYEIPLQNSPSEGGGNAKVTVVEFSDFQCPHCGDNHKHMPGVIKSFGDDVRVVYKNYPLDPACNSGGMHHQACMAAFAARCVYKQKGPDAFRQMQDYLFSEQEVFDEKSVQAKATELGVHDIAACMDSNEIKEEVGEEISLGKSLGVEGTPSIYVNGKFLKMATNPDVLRAVIKELAKK